MLGLREPLKNSGSHIDASHSRQPLVKGEGLVCYEVNAVIHLSHRKFLQMLWSGLQTWFPRPCCHLGAIFSLSDRDNQREARSLTAKSMTDRPWPPEHWPRAFVPVPVTRLRLLPRRVCCSQRCAMPVQHMRTSEQAQEELLPREKFM